MERDMGPDTTENPNKTSIGQVKREMRWARVEGNHTGRYQKNLRHDSEEKEESEAQTHQDIRDGEPEHD